MAIKNKEQQTTNNEPETTNNEPKTTNNQQPTNSVSAERSRSEPETSDVIDMATLMADMVIEKNKPEPKPKAETLEPKSEEDETEDEAAAVETTAKEVKASRKSKHIVAKGIHGTVDFAIRQGVTMISGEEPERISSSEEDDLINLWADMVEENGWGGIPPWFQLVMVMLFAYGGMFTTAFKKRKENMQLEQEEEAAKEHIAVPQYSTQAHSAPSPIVELNPPTPGPDLCNIKTDFEIPKKVGRGKRPKAEQELFDTVQAMKAELDKVKEIA